MIAALLLALAATGPGARPACRTDQLSLGFDGEGGAFNGMSHSGALLVVRNIGASACTLPGLPLLAFRDAAGRALPIGRAVPVGMHPGPVVLPVAIAPGAEVTAPLRWVSGAVYDRSRCFDTATAVLAIGRARIGTAIRAHICGRAQAEATFTQPPLRPDPTLEDPAATG